MPKIATAMSALEVKRLSTPGLNPVGVVPGLNLRIRETGSKSWALRVRIKDKPAELGLGNYPEVTLAAVIEKARQLRQRIKEGHDPRAERKVAQDADRRTFRAVAEAYITAHRSGWKNAKHAQQWANTLATYAHPTIGSKLVADVTTEDVLRCLTPIWTTKPETASRVRNRIELVLGYAMALGYRERGLNPAAWRGCVDQLLPKRNKVATVVHHEAIDWRYAGDFLKLVRNRPGMSARCLELVLLTACRSGEARLATWDEFDLEAKTWSLPGERMKSGRPHRVPLSDAAVSLLQSLPRFIGQDGEPLALVFPGRKDQALSDMSLTAVTRRMGLSAVPHGLRSTFRDWASEATHFPSEVVEMGLAHAVANQTEAAYRRGDLFDKRRELMAAWASYLTAPAASNVVNLRRAG